MNDIETFDITSLDSDINVACDGNDDNDNKCESPAKNILRMSCCGFALLMCEDCTEFIFQWCTRNQDCLHQYTCVHCNVALKDNTNIVILVGNL